MGEFIYGPRPDRITIDDRTLTHIKLVTLAKLRRNESFAINFTFGAESGGGRTTIWLSPQSFLQFWFEGSRRPAINRAWLDQLMVAANSPEGLTVVPEPPEDQLSAQPTTAAVPVQRPLT